MHLRDQGHQELRKILPAKALITEETIQEVQFHEMKLTGTTQGGLYLPMLLKELLKVHGQLQTMLGLVPIEAA